jgi:hypothetical protein
MAQDTPTTSPATPLARLFRGALWLFFALILLFPKLMALRRRPRAWNILRAILALTGAALIVADLVARAGMATAVAGAVFLLLALAIQPDHSLQSLDERARQLGALVVVNGGIYQTPQATPVKAHLCIGIDQVWILDAALSVKLELPLASLKTIQAQPDGESWKLSFLSRDSAINLLYTGPFAEHFARVAESAVRSQLHRELPILR